MENSFEHIEGNFVRAFINISKYVRKGGIIIFYNAFSAVPSYVHENNH